MVLEVIPITGGKGIYFPDSVINALGMHDKIVMETRANEIVITPIEQDAPRKNWSEAFKQMHEIGEDKLYFPDNNYDFEWESHNFPTRLKTNVDGSDTLKTTYASGGAGTYTRSGFYPNYTWAKQ